MKKILGLVAVSALLVGMLAGPAFAGATAVGVVGPGVARVSQTDVCPGDNSTGEGLYLPSTTPVSGYWRLAAPVLGSTGGAPASSNLSVCGLLGDVAGVGAACGVSHGYDGAGSLTGALNVDVENLEWVTSAGGTIPVTGDQVGGGSVAAVVQAQGGGSCTGEDLEPVSSPGGARGFTVVGVAALTA